MNYIRQLNAFEKWLGEHYLSNSAELLMRKILGIGNRKGWPEWVVIENLELMAVMRTKREATVIGWRDELIESGLLSYKKGKKKSPNRYNITMLYEINTTLNEQLSVENGEAQSVAKTVVKTVVKTADLSKHKQKLKKDILTDIQKEKEWDSFVSMRAKIKKPLTDRAAAMALSKLEELAPGDLPAQKKILDQSTYHCWQGLFPLKVQEGGPTNDTGTSEARPALPGVTRL